MRKFGTAPVFFTAIATILGAILFLRFGFAVGTLGFWGVMLIILLGHLVTIPTALALSEIATNKRVEGGGEYFIISRSFGLNIGSTIGVALYLAQAISVAFYVIAFTEAFEFFFVFMKNTLGIHLPRQVISIPTMLLLSMFIIHKGANVGVKALYYVVAILFIVLLLFFFGSPTDTMTSFDNMQNFSVNNMSSFFVIFAIIFPAFTGMTAGVGLSGDLKNPSKSIPWGTMLATIIGMFMYIAVAWKLSVSATSLDLVQHQLVMGKIAIGGALLVPIGLAASTVSSALGSVMVAPRTLQALSKDLLFPSKKMNDFFAKERAADGEPMNASILTCAIAFIFVAMGDVNAVAEIISMFFMLTYGSLCLISFLHHFGASPSYRPEFKSKWWISLIGFLVSVWVMFQINAMYALLSFTLLTLVYVYINKTHTLRGGLSMIFVNTVFQLNRKMQVFVQKKTSLAKDMDWRPSIICVSKKSFERDNAIRLLDWLSHTYGFATYLHKIEGYFSAITAEKAKNELNMLIDNTRKNTAVFIDTIISPSYTTAIVQAIQTPGISGMDNNTILFDFDKNDIKEQQQAIDNFNLVKAGNFDVLFLSCDTKSVKYENGIHVWINVTDDANANLMIMLSFIILNHPDWHKASIKVFVLLKSTHDESYKNHFISLVKEGRIPITLANIEFIVHDNAISAKTLMKKHSERAGLLITGVREENLNHYGEKVFADCADLGDILYVYTHNKILIE